MNYYPNCVYTIVNGDVLEEIALERRSFTHTEKKIWKSAVEYLKDAESKSEYVPVIFGNARDCSQLLYWGLLRKVDIHEFSTMYEVDFLRPLPSGYSPQDLVLASSGEHIAPGFIRPYALCMTPTFLNATNEMGTFISPEEGAVPETYVEGSALRVTVNSYERNATARKKCIEYYGCGCAVCGFDFEKTYGEIGRGFIHVHHLKPISETGESYEVEPVADLRPVCPNCHAMLHTSSPALSIEELKLLIQPSRVDTLHMPTR